MSVFEAIILGIVQGLTEFLPVSSSGHLIVVQNLLHIEGDMLFFDIMLHLGTLVAVCAVFYKDILALFKPPFKTIGLLIIATIPAGVAMLFLKDSMDIFFGGKFLFIGFLITAIILLITEIIGKKFKRNKEIGVMGALVMGFAQAVAVVPGISRSGSTICGGVLYGAERSKVASFSFLMSIPVILGSGLVSIVEAATTEGVATNIGVMPVICGVLAAAVSGYLAIRLMLRVIVKCNYKWFSLYLAAMAIFAFCMFFL